jgi:Dna[CI] antecedent, DciA
MHNRRPEDQVPASLNTSRSNRTASSTDGLQPLSALLPPRVQNLESQAKTALALGDRVRAMLPEPDKNHIVSASYQDDALLIRASSPEWCTHIRFRESELREAFATRGERPFTKLKVRVGRP